MRLALLFIGSYMILLCSLSGSCKADDSPGFFLKITKNVPRLGRRADKEYESYFLKTSKVIPRIGRGDDVHDDTSDLVSWLTGISQPSKRRLLSSVNAAEATEREYSVVQPVNSNTLLELLDRNAIPSEHVKFVHWKDFDRALQLDADLYAKVISLGRRPDQSLKEDLNLGGYIPLFSNSYDGGTDYMLYNKDNSEIYTGRYDRDFLHYNHLK